MWPFASKSKAPGGKGGSGGSDPPSAEGKPKKRRRHWTKGRSLPGLVRRATSSKKKAAEEPAPRRPPAPAARAPNRRKRGMSLPTFPASSSAGDLRREIEAVPADLPATLPAPPSSRSPGRPVPSSLLARLSRTTSPKGPLQEDDQVEQSPPPKPKLSERAASEMKRPNEQKPNLQQTASEPSIPVSRRSGSLPAEDDSSNSEEEAKIDEDEKKKDSFQENRLRKLQEYLHEENLDIEKFKKLSWRGLPAEFRAKAWRVLLGYLPHCLGRRVPTLKRKRLEYTKMVKQYYPKSEAESDLESTLTEQEMLTFRQISIDVPRTHPKMKLFQLPIIQAMLRRILYIWALRHPATGYVQGFNDLGTAFVYLFLDEAMRKVYQVNLWPAKPKTLDFIARLPKDVLSHVEADSFWCLNALLEQIQDHYIFAQPALQQMMFDLEQIVRRIDGDLHKHLVDMGVSFLHFSFRWMNCLLLREIKLHLILRLWDTYLCCEEGSISTGFTTFHTFVCAAFLHTFSKELRKEKTLESVIILLQNLPTQRWKEEDVAQILAEAYVWHSTFANTKR